MSGRQARRSVKTRARGKAASAQSDVFTRKLKACAFSPNRHYHNVIYSSRRAATALLTVAAVPALQRKCMLSARSTNAHPGRSARRPLPQGVSDCQKLSGTRHYGAAAFPPCLTATPPTRWLGSNIRFSGEGEFEALFRSSK
jgi:hypothetical protein